jgi:hypothetical protein
MYGIDTRLSIINLAKAKIHSLTDLGSSGVASELFYPSIRRVFERLANAQRM